MTKEQQKQMNEICMKKIEKLNAYVDSLSQIELDHVYVNRLRYCSAHVLIYPRYYVLISYQTPVAFIDRVSGEAYDVLRYVYGYTATSAQHISKFFHDYSCGGYYPETVYTYR